MPLDIRIRFGRAIRRIREEQKINQKEAAERWGLHRTYYSGIERGVRKVSLVNMESRQRVEEELARTFWTCLSQGQKKVRHMLESSERWGRDYQKSRRIQAEYWVRRSVLLHAGKGLSPS